MQIPQIQIHQTFAKLGMESKPAQLQIQQPKAKVQLHQEQLKVQIQSKPVRVLIDQSRAWDALGLASVFTINSRVSAQANQMALQGIARRAEEGDRLATIQNKQDPIPQIAAEHVFSRDAINYFGSASSGNVSYDVIPATLNIGSSGGNVTFNSIPRRPIIDYNPGQLDIYVQQKNTIQIEVPKVDVRM